MKRRVISLVLAVALIVSMFPLPVHSIEVTQESTGTEMEETISAELGEGVSAEKEAVNYSAAYALPVLTGDQAVDTANIAKSQLGYAYSEGTVYGNWWNSVTNWGVDYTKSGWCAMFACWCAYQAGAGLNVAYNKNGASPSLLLDWFKANATYDITGSTAPKAGDFIFFKSSGGTIEHVAVVTAYDSSTKVITFVGGNQGNGEVTQSTVTWGIGADWWGQYVAGYGRPKYTSCSHEEYKDNGICKECGEVFNWTRTLDTNAAGVYTVSKEFTPRLGGPYDTETKDTTTFSAESKVSVLGSVENAYENLWYQIAYGSGKIGYVYGTYLTYSSAPLTVSYNANGGSGAPAAQTKIYGSTLTLRTTQPTRSGYTFLGWSTSSSATSATYAAGGSYTVNASATLYAVWRQDSSSSGNVTITTAQVTAKLNSWKSKLNGKYWNYYDRTVYDGRRSEVEANLKAIVDNGVLDQSSPSNAALGVTTSACGGDLYENGCRSNYFSGGWQCFGFGWWLEYALFKSTYQFAPSDWNVYSGSSLNSISLQPGDYVRVSGHTIIVSDVSGGALNCVEAWGGSGCKISWSPGFNWDQYTTASAMLNAVKNNGGTVYRYKYIGQTVTGNTISYNPNGGSCGTGSQIVVQGSAVGTMPAATLDGHIFEGWYTSASGGTRYDEFTVPSGDVTLYTHWSSDYADLGDEFVSQLVHTDSGYGISNVSGNVELGDPDDITSRWCFYRQSCGGYKLLSAVDGLALDVYNASTANDTNVWVYEDNGSLAQLWYIQEKDGGYCLRSACSGKALDVYCGNSGSTIGTNVQMYTAYNPDAQRMTIQGNTVTVCFDPYPGTGTYHELTKIKGEDLAVPTEVPEWFPHSFSAWVASDSNGNEHWVIPGGTTSVDEDVTFSACWVDPIEIDSGLIATHGNTTEITNEICFPYQEYYYSITPTQANISYRFEGTGSIDSKVYLYDANGTLLASDDDSGEGLQFLLDYTFTDMNTYYVSACLYGQNVGELSIKTSRMAQMTYDANGGTGAPATQVYQPGMTVTVPDTIPVRTGYEFLGWSYSPTATSTNITAGSLVGLGGDGILYAVWTPASYTITYDFGDTDYTESQTVRHGESTTITTTIISYYDKTFLGWGNALLGTADFKPGEEITCSGDITLTAIYEDATVVQDSTTHITQIIPLAISTEYLGAWASYKFVPNTTTSYMFASVEEEYIDNAIVLFDENGVWLASDDNSGENDQYNLTYELVAGNTYYICVYRNSEYEGEFSTGIYRSVKYFYDANGGSNAPTHTYAYGRMGGYLSNQVPTRTGYTFLGWSTDPNATAAEYQPGEYFGSKTECTLYAVWEETECSHVFGAWTEVKAPTCTESGTERLDCTKCDYYETRRIDAIGHNYTAVVTDPTCYDGGYTTYTCENCGHSYVGDEVPAGGHTFGAWTQVKAPTCTATGTERRECISCDHYETRTVAVIAHDYEAVVTAPTCTKGGYTTYTCDCGDSYVGDRTEATGHDYDAVVTAPTCTTGGYTTYTCDCGDSYVGDNTAATGHSYGAWIQTKAPACTATGIERRDCANCDRYETRSIDATGHNHTAVVTEPTCTEGGYTTYTCTCGDSYIADETAPNDHSYGEWYETKAPACMATGTERRDCANCDSYETQVIPATGHSYGEWYESKAATCTSEGQKRRDCAKCDGYQTQKIAMTDHSYTAVVTAPTCTEGGYTTYTCACGDSYVGDETAAAGHSWGQWYETKAPTATTGGQERRDCANCGHYETRSIAATGAEYTVTYDANGGTGAPASQIKIHGHSLTLSSTVPVRDGYTFLGWATDATAADAEFSAGDAFTADADTTLYAVWEKDTGIATIITQPVSVEVKSGETAAVTVEAEGDGLTYTWYYRNVGASSFSKTTAFDGPTYSVEMTEARSGRQVYCLVKDQYGNKVQSDVVTLTMYKTPLMIVTQPESVEVKSGETALVEFEAQGDGLTYTWYYKNSGSSSFSKTTSFTGPSYSVTMSAARDGRQVYCLVTDQYGSKIKTDVVTLSVHKTPLTIVTQPESVEVKSGETALVEFEAQGDGLTYTWYYKNPGASSFSKTTTFTGPSYSVAMTASRSGRQVYCLVKDEYGNKVKTDVVTLTMYTTPLAIVSQSGDMTVAEGETAVVTVEATGDDLTYEWYYKNAGASSYKKTSTFTGNYYTLEMNASRSGRRVYCKITDAYGNTVKTKSVLLTMKTTPLEIVTQPEGFTIAEGETGEITLEATGDGLTYTWYYKNATASKFSKTSTFTGPYYSLTMTDARSGRHVYCKITDAYGNSVTTDIVTLNMESELELLEVPEDVVAANGETVEITVFADGENLKYAWYYRNAGKSEFTKTSTFKGDSYSLEMNSTRNGREVYCVITDSYGNTVATDVVTFRMG